MARKNSKDYKGECMVPECTREAYCLGMCPACYQRTYYWHRKTLKEKVRRVNQIKVWESSLEMQIGAGNVVDIGKRRKTG